MRTYRLLFASRARNVSRSLFLEFLGAEEVSSMDFSDYEQSELVHDLNEPIPSEWRGRYDFVLDGGTLEHVFNFPCAIRNAMELVAVGGHFYGEQPGRQLDRPRFLPIRTRIVL